MPQIEAVDEKEMFLAANMAYTLRWLRSCGATAGPGSAWAERQSSVLMRRCQAYKEAAWGPIMTALVDGASEMSIYRGFAGALPDHVR